MKKGDAERTKNAILDAARRLFAERDISSVSIRDIAEAAGVSHGLVQRYFGTREQMIEGIIRQEVDAFSALRRSWPDGSAIIPAGAADFREMLASGMARFHDFAALIVRAELGGIEPERMLDPTTPTPAADLAAAISARQADLPPGHHVDARLISAYVNAAFFAFSTMAPFLMASVGLAPEDYDARLDEILEISVRLILMASEPSPGEGSS